MTTLAEVEAELERRRQAAMRSLPNGRATLNDVDAEIARRNTPPQRRNRPRSNNPEGSRPGANGLSAENRQWLDARARRAQLRAPQGAPGTPLRMLEDFNRNGPAEVMNQMWRNLGVGDELAGFSAQIQAGGIPGTDRGRTEYNAARSYERDRQRQVAQDQPGVNVGSYVASVPAMGGTPLMNLPRVGMLEAGAGAAGINAPFALGRQEGSFMERLPRAAQETAIVGGAGAALQGGANALLRQPAANSTAARAQEFQQAGVRAPLAAVQGRQGAPMAMSIAENPVGGNVRRHLQNSVDDVQAAHQRLVAQAGTPEPRDVAGEIVQRGVRRFANGRDEPMPAQLQMNANGRVVQAAPRQIATRDWSLGAKSKALYDDVFGRLAADENAMIQGGIQGYLVTSHTEAALQNITTRVSGAASREAMASPMITRIQQALSEDVANGTLRFQDLRAWRTWVREAQRNEGLRQGLDNAALQRLEQALTTDIYQSAMQIGGVAAHELRQVDRWYRAAMNRINTALQPFDNAPGGAQAFRRVIDLASQGGRQNTRQLLQLRQSLRPDEWRSVGASIMDELGRPSFGNANVMEQGAFSIERFVTNVARLSPEGREALFGPQLARELENLARVAGYLKGVRGFANHSHTASSLQNVSTIGGVATAGAAAATGNAAPLGMLVAAGIAMRITGEMLTNPAFVRWLTSPGSGGLKRQLAALATIASRDPAVAPLYTELARSVGDRSPSPADPQSAYSQPQP